MRLFLEMILIVCYMVFGGLDIGFAVMNYKAGRYLRFGIDCMFAFCMAALFVKTQFTYF